MQGNRSSPSSRGSQPHSREPLDRGGAQLNEPQPHTPPQLLLLRKKTANFMRSDPKDFADRALAECRFLLARTQRLSAEFAKLQKKKEEELAAICRHQEEAAAFKSEVSQLLTEKVSQWYAQEQSSSFSEQCRDEGNKLISQLKGLEERFKCHHKNFVNRCPSQFIEKLQKENEELVRKRKEPDVNKKQNALIFKEIAEIKQNFEKQILAPKQGQRQAAEKQLATCGQKIKNATSEIQETKWTAENIFLLQVLKLKNQFLGKTIEMNQRLADQITQQNKTYYDQLYGTIINQFERFAKLTEAEQSFERPKMPRPPQQPRSVQLEIRNYRFNP